VTAVALYEKLPSDVRAILRIGRQARNEIAHELTLSIAEEIQNEEGRRTFLRLLRRTVAKIAEMLQQFAFLSYI
jgi:ERCC4-related helicase